MALFKLKKNTLCFWTIQKITMSSRDCVHMLLTWLITKWVKVRMTESRPRSQKSTLMLTIRHQPIVSFWAGYIATLGYDLLNESPGLHRADQEIFSLRMKNLVRIQITPLLYIMQKAAAFQSASMNNGTSKTRWYSRCIRSTLCPSPPLANAQLQYLVIHWAPS